MTTILRNFSFISLFIINTLFGIDCKTEYGKIWDQHIQKVAPRDQQWIETLKISSKSIAKILDHKESIKNDFERMKEIAIYFTRDKNTALAPDNLHKNRYTTVVPYDDVRTCRHLEGFYLSSSDVITDQQAYIVTQAPLESTLQDFWTAVLESKVTTIVKLMYPAEGKKNCPHYDHPSKFPYRFDGWNIEYKGAKILAQSLSHPSQMIVERKFYAIHKKSGRNRSIRHLHYDNWPDGGCPDTELFVRLLEIVDEKQKSSDPILVHCAAGVGRSGMFVLAHTLRKQLLKSEDGKINPLKTLLSLRMQRSKLVSNTDQYRAVLKALIYKKKSTL